MSNSIPHDVSNYNYRPEPDISSDFGHLGPKKIESSAKWKPLFVVLVILGVGGFVAVGVGFAGLGASQGLWSAGLLNPLGQVNSIVMIMSGTVVGSVSFVSCILTQIKTSPPIYAFSDENGEEVSKENSESIATSQIEEESVQRESFGELDLSCLVRAISAFRFGRAEIKIDGKTYIISYQVSSSTLKIEEARGQILNRRGLEIVLNQDEEIDFIRINGSRDEKTKKISGNYLVILEQSFYKLLELSSSYKLFDLGERGPDLYIKVFKDSIKKIPQFHLQQLASKMVSLNGFHVKFRGEEAAADTGGPSREYFGLLFDSIINSPLLCFKRLPSGLVIPRTRNDYENGAPLLTEDEKMRFEQIGKIIMSFCDQTEHRRKIIGRHFEDSFFKALLCLTSEEIDTPFEELTLSTKLKMCSALLTDTEDSEIYLERIELLSQEEFTESDLNRAAQIAFQAECLPEDLIVDDEPDSQKIVENRERVLKALEDSLFGAPASFGELGTQLPTLLAIAKGMKERCWDVTCDRNAFWDDNIAKIDFREFSNAVQGTLSRKHIVDSIELSNSYNEDVQKEMEKKVGWLKKWLLDDETGSTEEEIRQFLKFATGSKSLPAKQIISVTGNYDLGPIPKSHTCSYTIELSSRPAGKENGCNDFTEEAFINVFKEAIVNETFDFL